MERLSASENIPQKKFSDVSNVQIICTYAYEQLQTSSYALQKAFHKLLSYELPE